MMMYLKAAAGLAVAVAASGVAAQDRNSLFQSQTRVLDGRAAQQYSRSISLQPTSVPVPPQVTPSQGRGSGPYLDIARSAAQRHGIPEDLFLRLVQRESGWNPQAVSHKGAIGLAQLMPATARGLGVDPHDPESNLNGGARYLRMQFDSFGSWPLALAAYNAGPAAVSRHGGVPPYAETKDYVVAVWGE